LPLRTFFESPTVAGLAEHITRIRRAGTEDTEPLVPVLRSKEGGMPLSFAQRRLWLLQQLEPESASYNIAVSLRINGQLDRVILQRCIQEIVRRHENLRTTFALSKGQPVQVIHATIDCAIVLVQLQHLSFEEREWQVQSLGQQEASQPFDLSVGPLVHLYLLQ